MEIEIPDSEDAACDLDQLNSYFMRRGQYVEAAMVSGAARRIRSDGDRIAELEREIAELRAQKDGAYLERNRVVSALSKVFPAGVSRTAIEGWSSDWHGCVYIDLPTGQASWHFHDSQAYLFEHLPPYRGSWDGHTTEQKYDRLASLTDCAPEIAELQADLEWATGVRIVTTGSGEGRRWFWRYSPERRFEFDGTPAGLRVAIRKVRKGES